MAASQTHRRSTSTISRKIVDCEQSKCHRGTCFLYVTYLCEISCVFVDSKGTGMLYCSTNISRCGQFYLDTRTSHDAPGNFRMRRSCRICNMYNSRHLENKIAKIEIIRFNQRKETTDNVERLFHYEKLKILKLKLQSWSKIWDTLHFWQLLLNSFTAA